MKRLYTISVIIVLTVLFITACGKEPQAIIEFSISPEYKNTAMDICMLQDKLYIAAKNNIAVYTKDGREAGAIICSDYFISQLAVAGETLYAYDELNRYILEISDEGDILREIPLCFDDGTVEKMVGTTDTLFFLIENDAHENELLIIRLQDDEQEVILLSNLYDIGAYDNNRLMIKLNMDYFLFDPATQETELYYRTLQQEEGFTYDPQNGILYYILDQVLYSLDENSQRHSVVKLLDHPYYNLIYATDSLVMLDQLEKNIFVLYPEINNDQPDVIYTYGFQLYSDLYTSGLEDFEMAVVNCQMPEGGEEEFLQELMSGSSEADIYIVWDSKYWAYHMYTDLSVSGTLVECVEHMHSVLKASAYQGDELAGIPVRVMGTVMAYNQLSDGYPLVNELIINWDDLLAFLNEFSSQYSIMANKAALYQLLFEEYVYGYGDIHSGTVNFDTEEFYSVLNIMKQIYDSPHFQEPGSGTMMSYGDDLDFRAADAIGINRLVVTNRISDPRGLPAIESDNPLSPQIEVAYAVVNPNSERKEAAIHYLEMLATGNAFSETAELFPSEENENLNAYMEAAMVCDELDLYRIVATDIDSWLKNQTSLEETVEAIQEKSNLFFKEYE